MELDHIYQRYVNDLYRYLFSLSNDHFLAEEMVQETFFRAYLHLEENQFDFVKPWLFKVGYRVFIDYTRKQKRIISQETMDEPLEFRTPEHGIIEKEGLNRLLKLIHTLPEKEAHVILLCDFHQLKLSEASDVLNLNLNTLKSHLIRGRKKLKTIIQKEDRY
ncbi:RNA polymerase subunit sigma [Paenibacillus macquariensis subsp. defensor]|nr:RNA polymerase subunit sigma [Paenibacillus macquariensis subsp. defensor]